MYERKNLLTEQFKLCLIIRICLQTKLIKSRKRSEDNSAEIYCTLEYFEGTKNHSPIGLHRGIRPGPFQGRLT